MSEFTILSHGHAPMVLEGRPKSAVLHFAEHKYYTDSEYGHAPMCWKAEAQKHNKKKQFVGRQLDTLNNISLLFIVSMVPTNCI